MKLKFNQVFNRWVPRWKKKLTFSLYCFWFYYVFVSVRDFLNNDISLFFVSFKFRTEFDEKKTAKSVSSIEYDIRLTRNEMYDELIGTRHQCLKSDWTFEKRNIYMLYNLIRLTGTCFFFLLADYFNVNERIYGENAWIECLISD